MAMEILMRFHYEQGFVAECNKRVLWEYARALLEWILNLMKSIVIPRTLCYHLCQQKRDNIAKRSNNLTSLYIHIKDVCLQQETVLIRTFPKYTFTVFNYLFA